MPVSTEERLRFSERRGDPEICCKDAEKRGAWKQVLVCHRRCVWRSWGGVSVRESRGSRCLGSSKRALECGISRRFF